MSNTPSGKSSETLVELPTGVIVAGKFKLTELTFSHPVLGLTFNAINQHGDGFIVRVNNEDNKLSLVRSEAGILQEAISDFSINSDHLFRFSS
jgi:hypothetical protein